MRTLLHPTVEAVKAFHVEVLASDGWATGLRNPGLLESAISVPQATKLGEPVFKDAIEIAGAYLFYICQNHPFVDGNKRTALATCLVFLAENGLLKDEALNVDLWEALTLDVAASRLDRDQTTERLRKLVNLD
jgi:death-on-curing protein